MNRVVSSDSDLRAFDRLRRRLGQVAELSQHDRDELALAVAMAMVEDNRAGVLAGTDRHGNPAPPLQYRNGKGKRTAFRRDTDAAYGTATRGVRRNRGAAGYLRFKGLSDYSFRNRRGRKVILPNNNLSTWKYQELTGPRLAPRGDASRVIANYGPTEPIGQWDGRRLVVTCAWIDVVSAKGKPFLQAHFKGKNHLPKYDLAGVRPKGKRYIALQIVRPWVNNLLGLNR